MAKRTSKKFGLVPILCLLVLLSAACSAFAEEEHGAVTKDFMELVNNDAELYSLVEESINKAKEINPDKETNPAQSMEELYDFLDWADKCMPWNAIGKEYPTLYDSIDQSLDYFYFLFDQPLDELKDKGYYYPTLSYHEPIASWIYEYAQDWGSFLSTSESWNGEYYNLALKEESFGLNKGWYGDENIWTSFNDFFSRKLKDKDQRPIASSDLVSPADSVCQGVWEINEDGTIRQKDGVQLKSQAVYTISELLGPDSAYQDAFNGGTLTHTFLDVNDYHRYHFPIGGTVKEVYKIHADTAVGGITEWDSEAQKYELYANQPGWQMVETRDCVVLETEEYGNVAILPIGMSQICSCNFEDNVKVGAMVSKGDPLGYFLFGGSDIVMLFEKGINVELLMNQTDGSYEHLLMGQPYAELSKN